MPTRLIKESICFSDSIDTLSWFEEALFYRLIVNCDDYGRMDARPAILKSRLFPLKEGVTQKQIDAALSKLSTVGMVQVYTYDQKPFLQLVNWAKHQVIRNKRSKYPDPPAIENNCMQMKTNSSVIQSESNSESNILPGAEAPGRTIARLPLNDGTFHNVLESDANQWAELYPAVDVEQELRAMIGWCNANKTKRKTARGINRFINSWLSREQDKGGTAGYTKKAAVSRPETTMTDEQIAAYYGLEES